MRQLTSQMRITGAQQAKWVVVGYRNKITNKVWIVSVKSVEAEFSGVWSRKSPSAAKDRTSQLERTWLRNLRQTTTLTTCSSRIILTAAIVTSQDKFSSMDPPTEEQTLASQTAQGPCSTAINEISSWEWPATGYGRSIFLMHKRPSHYYRKILAAGPAKSYLATNIIFKVISIICSLFRASASCLLVRSSLLQHFPYSTLVSESLFFLDTCWFAPFRWRSMIIHISDPLELHNYPVQSFRCGVSRPVQAPCRPPAIQL